MKNKIINSLNTRQYLEAKRFLHKIKGRKKFELSKNELSLGYSLDVVKDKGIIFVHVPKCAGISINKAIYNSIGAGHLTLEQYSNYLTPKEVCEYFKFTVVRNPWDRLVSAFFFLKSGGMNTNDLQFSQQELSQANDFESFIENWLTEENIWKVHHFRPQYHYLTSQHNKISVDYIAFLENLSDDLSDVGKFVKLDFKVEKNNKSNHKSYTSYYTNSMIEKVREIYKRDIELLGYDFDNENIEQQIKRRDEKYPLDNT